MFLLNLLYVCVLLFIITFLIFKALRVSIEIEQSRRQTERILHRDRQGNIFTIADNNLPPPGARLQRRSSFTDVIILSTAENQQAHRMRNESQEKDDNDLPTYEEVMALTSQSSPTNPAVPLDPTALPPLPPYCEVDPTTGGTSRNTILTVTDETTHATTIVTSSNSSNNFATSSRV